MSPSTARVLRGAAGLAGLFVLLEVVSRAGIVDPRSLPPASVVVVTAARLLTDPDFLVQVAGTLLAWGLGLGLAVLVAVPAGIALGSSRRGHASVLSIVELLRPIPSVALIPLAILLLGRGLDMKVALIAYASTWPILLNTIAGVHEVDPVAGDTARAYGLGRWARLTGLVLPAAAPVAFGGIRIGAAIALIVAISAELIAGGGSGLGTWMLGVSQAGAPRELAYAGVVVAGLLGLVLDGGLQAADRRLFAWHHARRVPG